MVIAYTCSFLLISLYMSFKRLYHAILYERSLNDPDDIDKMHEA